MDHVNYGRQVGGRDKEAAKNINKEVDIFFFFLNHKSFNCLRVLNSNINFSSSASDNFALYNTFQKE